MNPTKGDLLNLLDLYTISALDHGKGGYQSDYQDGRKAGLQWAAALLAERLQIATLINFAPRFTVTPQSEIVTPQSP